MRIYPRTTAIAKKFIAFLLDASYEFTMSSNGAIVEIKINWTREFAETAIHVAGFATVSANFDIFE